MFPIYSLNLYCAVQFLCGPSTCADPAQPLATAGERLGVDYLVLIICPSCVRAYFCIDTRRFAQRAVPPAMLAREE